MLYLLALIGAAACVAALGWAVLLLRYRLKGRYDDWEEYP